MTACQHPPGEACAKCFSRFPVPPVLLRASELEAALRALVDALPKCSSVGCVATATTTLRFEERLGMYYMDVLACAEHAHEGAEPLTYGDALRAALALLGET